MNTANTKVKRERWATSIACGIVGLMLGAGLVYSLKLQDRLRYPDEHDYVAIARNLVAQQSYSIDGVEPTAFRAPGYAFALAGVTALGGGVLAFRLFNFTMLAGSMGLLFMLLRRDANAATGLVAVALCACYPVLFYTASTLYPQTMAACLFLLACFIYFGKSGHSMSRAAVAGVVMGMTILTVPTFVLALAVAVVGMTWTSFRFWQSRYLTRLARSLTVTTHQTPPPTHSLPPHGTAFAGTTGILRKVNRKTTCLPGGNLTLHSLKVVV